VESKHQNNFLRSEHLVLSTGFALVSSGVRFAAVRILSAGKADAGVVQAGKLPLAHGCGAFQDFNAVKFGSLPFLHVFQNGSDGEWIWFHCVSFALLRPAIRHGYQLAVVEIPVAPGLYALPVLRLMPLDFLFSGMNQ
jgi:hypothetical protein